MGPYVVSRRFGVVQGGKLRAVDDYSVSRINGTLSATECIDPSDVDQITANCRAHEDALVTNPDLWDPRSPFMNLERHADVGGDALLLKLWDIASAYRNLSVANYQRHLAVVAVWGPRERRPRLF